MAYVNQEFKAKAAPVIRALLKKYGLKGSLSVRHHSTLALTVQSGPIDFIAQDNQHRAKIAQEQGRTTHTEVDHIQINTYWCHEQFTGTAKDFLIAAVAALKGPEFFDESDSSTDYFNCSHYIDINIGRWDRPYVLTV